MYLEEFISYVEKKSRAVDIFFDKALDYQNQKNAKRKPAARWNESRIDREVSKMWDEVIKNTYASVSQNIKSIKDKPRFFIHDEEIDYWLDFLNEYEFLESFTDGISELEFE